MMRAALALLSLFALPVQAGWEFSSPVEVGAVAGKTLFHHLESANRKALAESGGRVAIVWEDNRAGDPRCWFALREPGAGASFSPPQAVTAGECYEPVVQGMGDGRFVLGWEEGGAVWVKSAGKGKALKLSREEAAHITLASGVGRTLHAAWAERAGAYKRIVTARIVPGTDRPKIEYSVPLEDRLPADEQAYPALAATDGGVLAVWEDRRFRHTMIMAAHSPDGRKFSLPYRLIDVPQARARTLGAGMGSMRPTLAACGETCLVALWLDKRDFLSGYDVYAAFSQNGGRFFGRNLKVQDSFGENVAQWHASVAANRAGRVVAVWDDDRDGAPDVWLADWNGKEFSDDAAVSGASGTGAQSDPVIHLDASGRLHLAWLKRAESGGTQLWYASAVWKD